MFYKAILFVGISISLCACQSQTASESSASKDTVLTVNDSDLLSHDVSRQDLPMSDQLRLYNLDVQLHDQTLSSLRLLVEKQHQPQNLLNWNLLKPIAPRPFISMAPSWTQGEEALTPDTMQLDILCSYASYSCSKIIATLQEFTGLLTTPYQIRFYDFPQKFHRLGIDAAAAVQCIEGSAQENLKNYLWNQEGKLDITGLKGAINLYSSSPKITLKCMDSPKTLDTIKQRISKLALSGFNKTPSILIDGKYLARGKEIKLIVQHLAPDLDLPLSKVGSHIRWLESWGSQDSKYSWALIEHQKKVMRVTPGDKLGDGFIAHITEDNLSVIINGELVWLNKEPNKPSLATVSSNNEISDLQIDVAKTRQDEKAQETDVLAESQDLDQEEPMNDQERFERMIKTVKTQPLPEQWLEQQLMRQTELEESLNLTENKMEGKSLVKLNDQDIDGFYTSLGMLPGDVILRVNDQWIHEENNSLFQSLASEEEVKVSVMRNGLPVHFSFVIE